MVEWSVLIQEIDTLPPYYYGEVVDFVGYIKAKTEKKSFSLTKAAKMAAEEYRTDTELTAFSALDGVDFYETR